MTAGQSLSKEGVTEELDNAWWWVLCLSYAHIQALIQNAVPLPYPQPASVYQPDAFLGCAVMTHHFSLGKKIHDTQQQHREHDILTITSATICDVKGN